VIEMVDKEKLPMVCMGSYEYTILIERIEQNGIFIPHIATVVIGSDGSIYYKEQIDNLHLFPQNNIIKSACFHNWKEFKAFDTLSFSPAQLVEDWINENPQPGVIVSSHKLFE
jgi:hypothetical protein